MKLFTKEEYLKRRRDKYYANAEVLRAKAREYQRTHKDISNKWNLENGSKVKEKALKYYYSEKGLKSRQANILKIRSYKKKYKIKNKEKVSENDSMHRALKAHAAPPWVDRKQIEAYYKQAQALTLITGVKYNVDHIFPLRGKGFVGLHVPWNLQIIPAHINFIKGNRI